MRELKRAVAAMFAIFAWGALLMLVAGCGQREVTVRLWAGGDLKCQSVEIINRQFATAQVVETREDLKPKSPLLVCHRADGMVTHVDLGLVVKIIR